MFKFKKMHGLGNDFVIIDDRHAHSDLTTDQIRALAHRKRGVGCDQIVVMEPSESADLFMRIYNADGGEAGMCGNAARCVAHWFMTENDKEQCTLETLSGLLECRMAEGGMVAVDMGKPRLSWNNIPLAQEMDTQKLDFALEGYGEPVAVNVGNPHCVFFVDDVAHVPLDVVGQQVELNPLFPERTNVEFVQVIDDRKLRARVWERGTGETEACGSGACAVLVAAVRRNLSRRRAEIVLDGGSLIIEWDRENDHILMTGPVAYVFDGQMS